MLEQPAVLSRPSAMAGWSTVWLVRRASLTAASPVSVGSPGPPERSDPGAAGRRRALEGPPVRAGAAAAAALRAALRPLHWPERELARPDRAAVRRVVRHEVGNAGHRYIGGG